MGEGTRDRLITAANDLFFEDGYHAVGLDAILARAGVTKTTFYNHFESKDALIVAVLLERDRIEFGEWMELMARRGGEDPQARILALFDIVEDWLADEGFKGCMFLKAQAEYPSPNDPVHKAAMVHVQNISDALREQGRAAGCADPGGLAQQLMIVLSGAILTRTSTGLVDRARSARTTAGVLVDHHLGRAVAT
ncbi:MAG: TetR/AcrR family transcriptional regulator [Phycisphaerales bacterium]|jgi:AcrR family transcriptional regulator|nr:TetR/AcrR family transcriptional regulator [Phycisphaerales bacterium]